MGAERAPRTDRDLARRLVVGLQGPVPSARELAWLDRWRPAGIILFSRNVIDFNQLSSLCAGLKQRWPHLELMADHEGGPVSQLAAAAGRPPAPRTLGDLDDVDLTRRVHLETGRALAACGLDRVLAPCADVLTEPRNPVIGVRAFGAETELVCRHVAAATAGLRAAGLGVCLKHWPGHGGSRTDSHLAAEMLPDAATPAPFAAGVAAGADALMVGHLAEAAAAAPATLDGPRLQALRHGLQPAAGGLLLLADDVTMGALRPAMARAGVPAPDDREGGLVEPGDLSLAWLAALAAAGCDRLLIRGIPWGALPLPGPGAPPPTAGPTAPGTAPDCPAHREARRRAGERAGVQAFLSGGGPLLWLDRTAGDRWQVAAGTTAAGREALAALLSARFERLEDAAAAPGAGPCRRLLVSSHRPLAVADLAPEKWRGRLATEGRCLALGHPSLPSDLGRILGSDWVLGHLADVAADDLLA